MPNFLVNRESAENALVLVLVPVGCSRANLAGRPLNAGELLQTHTTSADRAPHKGPNRHNGGDTRAYAKRLGPEARQPETNSPRDRASPKTVAENIARAAASFRTSRENPAVNKFQYVAVRRVLR